MITAISPIDGRYTDKTKILQNYFSEHALFHYRVKVEIAYLLELAVLLPDRIKLKDADIIFIMKIITEYNHSDSLKIKNIEQITKHDIKAVEYYIKQKLESIDRSDIKEWVHFGLTSQDINNTAIPLSIKEFYDNYYSIQIKNLLSLITNLSHQWNNQAMLARTHGQAASPTTVGKEFRVFAERLSIQIKKLDEYIFSAKFGGATGNFNAHLVAFPDINWGLWADNFISKSFDMNRQQTTTQIAHYDEIAEWCQIVSRINIILIDMCRDVWQYISMDYFKQKLQQGEIGSSAMPHKVNPIDFENAEGNFLYANSILEFFAAKLPISRLQRDLTDSTVLRNIGVPLAHHIIALDSLTKGLNKIVLNEIKLKQDLNKNYAVIAEAIQTILRRENYPEPYEALKKLTRGNQSITKESLHEFISELNISENLKNELRNITPFNYIGNAIQK